MPCVVVRVRNGIGIQKRQVSDADTVVNSYSNHDRPQHTRTLTNSFARYTNTSRSSEARTQRVAAVARRFLEQFPKLKAFTISSSYVDEDRFSFELGRTVRDITGYCRILR
jgi:hypothetical protein